jgi:hypothetical protein
MILLGRCLPTTYCTIYYELQQIKDEQRPLIQQKKIMVAAGIEPMTSKC